VVLNLSTLAPRTNGPLRDIATTKPSSWSKSKSWPFRDAYATFVKSEPAAAGTREVTPPLHCVVVMRLKADMAVLLVFMATRKIKHAK
jgi:hypothetical protein